MNWKSSCDTILYVALLARLSAGTRKQTNINLHGYVYKEFSLFQISCISFKFLRWLHLLLNQLIFVLPVMNINSTTAKAELLQS